MRSKQLVLQVPPELKAEAEKLAAAERRSLSNWLRTVLEDRVRGPSPAAAAQHGCQSADAGRVAA
jgi:predicted transcriptional regulator